MFWIAFCLSVAYTIEGSDHHYKLCFFAIEIVAILMYQFMWAAWEGDGDSLNLADFRKSGVKVNLFEHSSFIHSFIHSY